MEEINSTWYEEYGAIIAQVIKYGNRYVQYCRKTGNFGTDFEISLFDIQIIEVIYLNEKHYMKMNVLADKLGMTQSAFSKNINRLVNMQLVKKYHAQNNKKDILLRVTAAGKETYELHSKYVYDKIFSRVIPIFREMKGNEIERFCKVLDIMGEFPQLLKEQKEDIQLLPIK